VNADAPAQNYGDLYDQLLGKVKVSTEGKQLKSITFVWMQGERDALEQHGELYADAFNGLLDQLREDLGRKDINFVIGRLSDFDMNNKRYPHWTKVREVQVKLAEASPRGAWINTDDLTDGVDRGGKPIHNDLHMSGEGYKIMSQRFAYRAIELINK
jgi:hypothetical protein